ncbi:MAG: D-tyrosyl-tRNA(Tyr) deacylase [Planctomycetota bacterium]|jgi:D-tyrosyl-tRNA(Tyr) deacylase|nr:D-tyrosyl-tRNA(Tyr) deacylase [Planctomycetota bacterium]
MRAVVQRVSSAKVVVDGGIAGEVGKGFLVLLGVTPADGPEEAKRLAAKIARLRVFEDEAGKMNLDLGRVGGGVLVVSQFTLYADASRGNRPSFVAAARPEQAEPLYQLFCKELEALGLPVGKGVFGAHMDVALVNAGPVTIFLDTDELRAKKETPK